MSNELLSVNEIHKVVFVLKNISQNCYYIRVIIGNIKTTFYGKHETIDNIKKRAINFIEELKTWQNTLLRETPKAFITTLTGKLD
jgi:hypothetical protein